MSHTSKRIQSQHATIHPQRALREVKCRERSAEWLFSMATGTDVVSRDHPILVGIIDLSHLQAA